MKTALAFALLMGTLSYSVIAQNTPVNLTVDSVLIAIQVVNPDKKPAFEKFLTDVFWAGAQNLNAADQKAFKEVVVNHPVTPNEDGTFGYFFFFKNPVSKDGDSYIKGWLTKMYGEGKSTEYFKQLSGIITFGVSQMAVETRLKN